MPEHIRALIVLSVLIPIGLFIARRNIVPGLCSRRDYHLACVLCAAAILLAHLSHSFWVFAIGLGGILIARSRRVANPLALFLFLAPVLPRLADGVPGLGVINFLLDLEYQRLLALGILLPAYLRERKRLPARRWRATDMCILAYTCLDSAMTLREGTMTSAIRHFAEFGVLDALLPYWAASRLLTSPEKLRTAMAAFLAICTASSLVLVVEMARGWALYATVDEALGVPIHNTLYNARGGFLRAVGAGGHPIPAGITIMVALGFLAALRNKIPSAAGRATLLGLLVAGMIATLSRAPWIGAAIAFAVAALTGPQLAGNVGRLLVGGSLLTTILLMSPIADDLLAMLPWIGTVDSSTVTAREELIWAGMRAFTDSPWTGRSDFMSHPEIRVFWGTDLYVDVTNTYLVVALRLGLAGLLPFAMFLLCSCYFLYRSTAILRAARNPLCLTGSGMLGTVVALVFVLFTVSPILIVPKLVWILGGMATAFDRITNDVSRARRDA